MNDITTLTSSAHRIPLFWKVCYFNYFTQLRSGFVLPASTAQAHMQHPGRKSHMHWQNNVLRYLLKDRTIYYVLKYSSNFKMIWHSWAGIFSPLHAAMSFKVTLMTFIWYLFFKNTLSLPLNWEWYPLFHFNGKYRKKFITQ